MTRSGRTVSCPLPLSESIARPSRWKSGEANHILVANYVDRSI